MAAKTYPTTTEITDENGVTNTYDLTHVAMAALERELRWKSAELLGLAVWELADPNLLAPGQRDTERSFVAMYLAAIYRLGHLGENDYKKAVLWYKRSDMNVKNMLLAGIYYTGRPDVPQDVAEANKFWGRIPEGMRLPSIQSVSDYLKVEEDGYRAAREAARQAATTPTEDDTPTDPSDTNEDDTSPTPTDPDDTGGTPDDGDTTTTPTGDDKDEDSSGGDNTP